MIVFGSISQNSECFRESRNLQCTFMAFTALYFTALYGVSYITQPGSVDSVLFFGDSFYNRYLRQNNEAPRLTGHYEIPDLFGLDNAPASVIRHQFYRGRLLDHTDDNDNLYGYVTLSEALRNSFITSNYLLATFGVSTIAIISFERGYILFDSHEGYNGFTVLPASVTYFSDLNAVTQHLKSRYMIALEFEISPFMLNFPPDAVFQNGDHNYYPLLQDRSIESEDFAYLVSNSIGEQSHRFMHTSSPGDVIDPEYFSPSRSFCDENCVHESEKNSATFPRVNHSNQNSENNNGEKINLVNQRTRETFQLFENCSNLSVSVNAGEADFEENSYTNVFKKARLDKVDIVINSVIRDNCQSPVSSSQSECQLEKPRVDRINDTIHSVIENNLSENTSTNRGAKLNSNDTKRFFQQINCLPIDCCSCCYRLLYIEQVVVAKTAANCDLSDKLNIKPDSILCRNCLKYLKDCVMPARCHLNNLELDNIPESVSQLNFLERRFICQVQTFMTLVILPGGQYAEKGLAIHFPCEVQNYLGQLPVISRNCPVLCTVGSVTGYIATRNIFNALLWLKEHNKLYSEIHINASELVVTDGYEGPLRDIVNDVIESGTIPIDFAPEVTLRNIDSQPISLGDDLKAEALAYPWLFPLGNSNTFKASRQRNDGITVKKLTLLAYYQSRFLHRDNRFRRDITYLIDATNNFERIRAGELIGICAKMYQTSNDNQPTRLTASDVKGGYSSNLRINGYNFLHKVRGTAAYWRDELFSLLARFKRLGPPDLFLTLSANDVGWSDLQLLINYDTGNSGDLRSNPVLAAMHFERRWSFFLKNVLLGKGNPLGEIVDYWARIEFQNRGSPHIHAFFWIKNAPSIWRGNSFGEVKNFIDSIISTQIPESDQDLATLVRKYQTHHHTSSCMQNGRKRCRFYFPRTQSTETKIFTDEMGQLRFSQNKFYETKRNQGDEFINAYNPIILSIWQANIDLQVVGGSFGLANYVCSYVCKAEPDNLRFALREIYNDLRQSPLLETKKALWRIAMAVLKVRQMSAQEAAFRICHLQLIYSSRQVIKLQTVGPKKRIKMLKKPEDLVGLDDDSLDIFQDSIVDYYHRRPLDLESICLYYFTSWYTVDQKSRTNKYIKVKKRNKFACVRTPQFSPTSEDYFYHLLLLYFPHRSEDELLKGFDSAAEAFENLYPKIDLSYLKNEECITEIVNSATRLQALGLVLTSRNLRGESISHDANSTDTETEMFTSFRSYSNDFRNMLNSLSSCQTFAFNYINRCLENQNQIKAYVFGEAGTGKSYLLRTISSFFQEIFKFGTQNFDPVVLCAPTGVAAINIGGTTIHSLLKLPVQHGYAPGYCELSAINLKSLRTFFKHKKILFVDEVSMVSSTMLLHMHRRLCSVFKNDNFFGGIHVIFCGDFFQLRPCRGQFAFTNTFLWDQLQPLYLITNKRQEGDKAFASLLTRARVGRFTEPDITLLAGRVVTDITAKAIESDLHLYPLRVQIKEFNNIRLQSLSIDNVCSSALDVFSHTDPSSGCGVPDSLITDDERNAGGLPLHFEFCVGSRVMLLRNLLLESRLVNGAMGYIRSFSVNRYGNIDKINVQFDDLSENCPYLNSEGLAEIEKITVDYKFKGRFMSRTQFPLAPSWACTIHKAQGLSLDTVVVDVGRSIFEAGQAYVAISRARTSEGLHLLELCPNKFYASDQVILNEQKMIDKFDRLKLLIDSEENHSDEL